MSQSIKPKPLTSIDRSSPAGEDFAIDEITSTPDALFVTHSAKELSGQESAGAVPERTIDIAAITAGSMSMGQPIEFAEAIAAFSDTVARANESFYAKLLKLLELGREYLGLEAGVLSRLVGTHLEVVAARCPQSLVEQNQIHPMHKGARYPLQGTFCANTIRQDEPYAFEVNEQESNSFGRESYLGSSIRVHDQIYGTFCFWSVRARTHPFSPEEKLFVRVVSRYIGNEIGRIRVKEALTSKMELEKLSASISRNFIELGPEEVDQGVRDALQRIAEFYGVDLSYVLIFKDNNTKMDISHWWMADHLEPTFRTTDIPVEKYTWSMSKIINRQVLVMPDHDKLPPEAEAERRFIKRQSFKTAILVPLVHAGKSLGFIGFGSQRRRISVDQDKVHLLEMVGHTLASAIENKRAQEALRNLEAQMQHSQKLESLGVLAGGIAHDFNNLLMGILGNAGIALNELSYKSPARLSIRRIEKISQHAADLTNQLLAYSGRGKFFIEVLNLSEVVEDMVELLHTVVSKKHVLKTNFATDLPAVECDPAQLSQVIMNLITNASEAIGDSPGTITLSTGLMAVNQDYLSDAYLTRETPDGVYVYLRVSDTGCGMDEETQARIFDPFFTTKFTGRGLGLAAVLGIVRGHRGTVKVWSKREYGTTFTVLLPCSDRQDALRSRGANGESEEDSMPAEIPITGSILVVDDEDSVRMVIAQLLQQFGFHVLTASDGRSALEVFESSQNDIDAVIVDMTMPDMDGQQVCNALFELRPEIRVILTSGYSEQEVTKQFTDKKFTGFIQKPFRPQALLKKVFEVLKPDED